MGLGCFKLSVGSFKFKKMRKKERGGARLKNVGAPTISIDVVVNEGLRKAGLQFAADSRQIGAEFSNRLEPPGLERWRGSVVNGIWLGRASTPHPPVFAYVRE